MMATVYSQQRGKAKFGLKFEEHLADLQRTQWYRSEKLRELQNEKLRRLLWHAERFVPFYQKQFSDLGIRSSLIEQREDLQHLPVLEKAHVQSAPSEFRSTLYRDDRDVEIISTSGTTGKALQIAVAAEYFKLEKAFLWLQRVDCGLRPGNPTAYFSGFPIIPPRQKSPPFWVYDRSENRLLFSVQHMGRDNLKHYAAEILRFEPQMIVGYANAISVIAAYLRSEHIDAVRPRGVFTSSGTLLPQQRLVLEQAFDCRVLDLYGQAEYCGMMIQCEHGNYHIKDEYGVIEILTRNGAPAAAGQIGEVICTGLNNMAMPFIRYRTGDTAVPKQGVCACGRGGALVERVLGRLDDIIVTPDGRLICDVMDFAFYVPHIQEAQVVQEATDVVRVRIVPDADFSEVDKQEVLANLRTCLGAEMRIHLETAEYIPRLPNGKFRFVISKVPMAIDLPQPGEMAGTSASEERSL
jgi:phenylacetate-CoA ligase